MYHAGMFLKLAFLAAGVDSPEATGELVRLLDSYFTEGTADRRCWSLVAVGAVIVAGAVEEHMPESVLDGTFWRQLWSPQPTGPVEVAAFQIVNCHLHADPQAALDVMTALARCEGFGAISETMGVLVRIAARLKRRGAFATS